MESFILTKYAKDSWASSIINGTLEDDRYMVVNDLIIYKGRIFLTLGLEVKNIVLRSFHDSPLASHPKYFKTYRQVWERFTWKGLKYDVLRYVRECVVCQKKKIEPYISY